VTTTSFLVCSGRCGLPWKVRRERFECHWTRFLSQLNAYSVIGVSPVIRSEQSRSFILSSRNPRPIWRCGAGCHENSVVQVCLAISNHLRHQSRRRERRSCRYILDLSRDPQSITDFSARAQMGYLDNKPSAPTSTPLHPISLQLSSASA
jgi:hypothetical protein